MPPGHHMPLVCRLPLCKIHGRPTALPASLRMRWRVIKPADNAHDASLLHTLIRHQIRHTAPHSCLPSALSFLLRAGTHELAPPPLLRAACPQGNLQRAARREATQFEWVRAALYPRLVRCTPPTARVEMLHRSDVKETYFISRSSRLQRGPRLVISRIEQGVFA